MPPRDAKRDAKRDALGWRAKFAAIGPSTNTVVQPDFEAMRPPGVTCHYRPIVTPNAKAISNESFKAGIDVIAGNVMDAVRAHREEHGGLAPAQPDAKVERVFP